MYTPCTKRAAKRVIFKGWDAGFRKKGRVKIEDLHEIIRKATDPKELYRKIVGDSMEDTAE